MPEEWERILPSWKIVPKKEKEETPQIAMFRYESPKKSCDRISLNKTAVKKLGIKKSVKCHILVQKKSRQAAIKIITDENNIDVDCFCLSLNKRTASIRRSKLFNMMDIDPFVMVNLSKFTFRTELTTKDGMFIFKLPDKSDYIFDIPEPPEFNKEDHKVDIDFAKELLDGL